MSKRFRLKVFLTTCLALAPAASAAAAEEKPRKSPPPRRERAASNESVRTQQRTADAMAAQTGRPTTPPKSQSKTPSKTDKPATPENAQATLEDVERRLRAEQERFAGVLSGLRAAEEKAVRSGNAKSVAAARKAIDRETAAHQRKTAPLLAQRDELRRKLGIEPAEPQGAGEPPVARARD